ncbi:hypothetical protein FQR65_LT20756 [Abscondita terminalis]|nr:hypothetical protein FQR65_LT20756 [Abscondita terminalis]
MSFDAVRLPLEGERDVVGLAYGLSALGCRAIEDLCGRGRGVMEGLLRRIWQVSHADLPALGGGVAAAQEVFVKIIDIDLERRRISLSLKQANEGVDPEGTEFDPALYGMTTEYDENGEYKYPEGFDPETQEWKEGFESQREKWEQEYAAAQERWEAHKKQVAAMLAEVAACRLTPESARIELLERVWLQPEALADDEALPR